MRRLYSVLSRLSAYGSSSRQIPFSSSFAGESSGEKLERIADELLSLNKIERHDYSILYRLRLGLDRWGTGAGIIAPSLSSSGGDLDAAPEEKEKTAFDIRLEKFDAAAKIKVIKEVRTFTDLGLKEAKEMVEKAPVVLKKGVSKDVADQIIAKLKDAGATAILE